MSTTPIGSYRLFQKLHPLSLLAQLTSRHATGCLRVYTETISWSIYLTDGKLTYASHSDQVFERLDNHLRRLSQQIPTLNSATRVQMRLMFEAMSENQSISHSDYQAICWLVDQDYLTARQAGTLIEDLAKDVLEPFLALKEGSYEFNSEATLDGLPKFCSLDLRLIVEHCQKQIRNRQNIQSQSPLPPAAGGSSMMPGTQMPPAQPQSPIQFGQQLSNQNNFARPEEKRIHLSKNVLLKGCIQLPVLMIARLC